MHDLSPGLIWTRIQIAVTAIGGWLGYFVGGALFGESASWVIAGIAGLCGYGANEAGRQYLEDLGT